MKIVIYALTFLGYAWSGYGANVITNLRDAVLTAEKVFGEVLENVVTVVKRFRHVRDVLDAAVEESCTFTCPSGNYSFICRVLVSCQTGFEKSLCFFVF